MGELDGAADDDCQCWEYIVVFAGAWKSVGGLNTRDCLLSGVSCGLASISDMGRLGAPWWMAVFPTVPMLPPSTNDDC